MRRYFIWYVVLCLLFIGLVVQLVKMIPDSKQYYPDSGTWYCDELQVQMCFDFSGDSYIDLWQEDVTMEINPGAYYNSFMVIDNVKMRCKVVIRAHRDVVYLYYYDPLLARSDGVRYSTEDCLFIGHVVSLTDSVMRVKDDSSGEMYIFSRVQ